MGAFLLLLDAIASARNRYGEIELHAGFVATALVLCWAVYQVRLRQIARSLDIRLDERVNERMRIARELHDTVLQSFQGLMLRFQNVRNLLPADPEAAAAALEGALDHAGKAIVEGRDAIQNLRSSTPGAIELVEAITALAGDEQRAGGAQPVPVFRASVEGTPRDLHPLLRDEVYRIAAEALCNAFRHAHATRIEAEVTYGARQLRLRIRDDGCGIEPRQHSAPARHWGLIGMRERACHIGSELSVWSAPRAGTEVELRVPAALAYPAPRRSVGAPARQEEDDDER
jgi:signal transduction histidine kinase